MCREQQNLIVGPIEGYKICNEDMTCRGVKFEIGKRVKLLNDDPLKFCKNGFHFCKHPSGVWNYYDRGRIFKVRAYGVLVQDVQPGASYKLVCEEIELYKEVLISKDSNTGNKNTGSWNTGNMNTGSSNIGDWNVGNQNVGNNNTGDWNTGDENTGDWNTGYGNIGSKNSGNWNTGDRNTGSWNLGSGHSGYFGLKEAPLYMFNKPTKVNRCDLDYYLINKLGEALQSNELFDISPFLALPNATEAGIKKLHKAWIAHRKITTKGRKGQ
jgi:hypothetical protein